MIHLDDFCERGEAWRTWEHMEFIDFSDPDVSFEGTDQHWLDFEGRMGNIEKQVKSARLELAVLNSGTF